MIGYWSLQLITAAQGMLIKQSDDQGTGGITGISITGYHVKPEAIYLNSLRQHMLSPITKNSIFNHWLSTCS